MIGSSLRRLVAACALGAVFSLSPVHAAPFPDRLELPDGFLPEGVAIGPGPTAWFGSRADGDLRGIDLRSGEPVRHIEGPGTPSVGVKTDDAGRIFVAGGGSGSGRVVDTTTGVLVADYTFTASTTTFVNDVVLTDTMAWFTDSRQPQLYGVPLDAAGAPDGDPVTLPLGGDWVQGTGNNANGISPTPDGAALLVVNSSDGSLHRVDPATGDTSVVDLGGAELTNGDGLLLTGRTLYAVQNRLNQVAVLTLDAAGTRGQLVDLIRSPDFDVPTTVAAFGRWLYLPNARFTTPQLPETAFWVTRVDR